MVIKPLTAQGLEELCSQEQLQLLNAVDSLRSQGVSHYISLPQIIVCGDQSSGKSSVLESISGVAFPVKSNLCTRFPTELILRKTTVPSISISIVPHHSRNESDKEALSKFQETLEDFKHLPTLIEKAKLAMGVTTIGKAFSNDILRIEVNGPDRPHLTIVDLPGLIHSETKHQSASDVKLITDIVKSYMKEARSIILAVVSAKNDYANQIVLKLARGADPRGTRTLGVITKPDTLTPGSASEDMYLSLARNRDIEFRLGWHVLRNRDTEVEEWTFEQRDAEECSFLSTGAWAGLPPATLGIKSLRGRLSKVLVQQIASELPHLIQEIAALSTEGQKRLDKLGQPRVTIAEQRKYLIEMSQSFQALIQAATLGTYNDVYFGDAMSTMGYQKRVRAVVQNLNSEFAEKLASDGRRHKIVTDEKPIDPESPNLLTRGDYIEKIVPIIQRCRGRELPGMFNSMIIAELFKELSDPWTEIAEQHVQKVWKAIRLSLNHLVSHIADSTTANAIFTRVFEPSLDSLLQISQQRLLELLKPHLSGHPITYNHYFTETLQNIRMEREKKRVTDIVTAEFGLDSLNLTYRIDKSMEFGSFVQRLVDQPEQNMDRFAASEALDFLNAYYKVAQKRFVDDVAVEVIEGLLNALTDIMDPTSVFCMTDADTSLIASETEENRATRQELEAKLKVLKSGTETCKAFSALYVNAVSDAENEAGNGADRYDDYSSETSGANPSAAQDEPKGGDQSIEEAASGYGDRAEEPSAALTAAEEPVPNEEDNSVEKVFFSSKSSKRGTKKKLSMNWDEPEPLAESRRDDGWA